MSSMDNQTDEDMILFERAKAISLLSTDNFTLGACHLLMTLIWALARDVVDKRGEMLGFISTLTNVIIDADSVSTK